MKEEVKPCLYGIQENVYLTNNSLYDWVIIPSSSFPVRIQIRTSISFASSCKMKVHTLVSLILTFGLGNSVSIPSIFTKRQAGCDPDSMEVNQVEIPQRTEKTYTLTLDSLYMIAPRRIL
jgi:hypothetical protein